MDVSGRRITLADILVPLGRRGRRRNWQIWSWKANPPWDMRTYRAKEVADHFLYKRKRMTVTWCGLTALAAAASGLTDAVILGMDPATSYPWMDQLELEPGEQLSDFRGVAEVFIQAVAASHWVVQSARIRDIDALRRHLQSLGLPCGIAGET